MGKKYTYSTILSGISMIAFLIRATNDLQSWLAVIAACFLLFFCVKKKPLPSVHMSIPLTIMAFRFIIISAKAILRGYYSSFTVIGIIIHLVIYALAIISWLWVLGKLNIPIKSTVCLLILSAIVILYGLLKFFGSFGEGFKSVLYYIGWITFFTSYLLEMVPILVDGSSSNIAASTPESTSGNAVYTDCVAEQQTATNSVRNHIDIASINNYAEKFVPKKLRSALPKMPAIGFIATYIASFVILIVLFSSVVGGGHDLSGTYLDASAPRFPVTRITFSTDGTFTSYCDYYEYNTGSPRKGTYSKTGNSYRLKYDSSLVGYDLLAQRQGDGSLKLSIVPKTTGFAWNGDYIYIYPW